MSRANFTYRGTRAKLDRGLRESLRLKRERIELGISRRELDRIRHKIRMDQNAGIS